MAHIEKPSVFAGEANNVSGLLGEITKWHDSNTINASDVHLRVWYRGHSDQDYILWPGVYRAEFTAAATSTSLPIDGSNAEEKRLNLERYMLDEFRTSGATLLNPDAKVDVYFAAQHSGMPTRLLDWTMNPLAALFFAVKKCNENKDGELLIMDAPKLLPDEPNVPKSIVGVRHPYAKKAIGVSFWDPKVSHLPALVLPIRPDNHAGRIGQQSSCFTLHMLWGHASQQSCVEPH